MAKILIVDDHADGREFLVTLLGYQGHCLLEATNGADEIVCPGDPAGRTAFILDKIAASLAAGGWRTATRDA